MKQKVFVFYLTPLRFPRYLLVAIGRKLFN